MYWASIALYLPHLYPAMNTKCQHCWRQGTELDVLSWPHTTCYSFVSWRSTERSNLFGLLLPCLHTATPLAMPTWEPLELGTRRFGAERSVHFFNPRVPWIESQNSLRTLVWIDSIKKSGNTISESLCLTLWGAILELCLATGTKVCLAGIF